MENGHIYHISSHVLGPGRLNCFKKRATATPNNNAGLTVWKKAYSKRQFNLSVFLFHQGYQPVILRSMPVNPKEEFEILEQKFAALNERYSEMMRSSAKPKELDKVRLEIKKVSQQLAKLRQDKQSWFPDFIMRQ